MKNKFLLLLSISLIIFNACGDSPEYVKVKIGDVIQITSDYSSYNKADIIFAWSPPISDNGSIPKFEIDNNSLYFSPDMAEKYSMKLTIESMGGKPIVEENFYYEGVEVLAESQKEYANVKFPSSPSDSNIEKTEAPNNTNDMKASSYYTVQIYARTTANEANDDLVGLNALGFEDIYIENFIKDDTKYWRVRSGKFNSVKKAEKRKKELSEVLKIKLEDLWSLEVK
tara:strand:- start:247 stop:927 length:681 start_codon:yes stop_codon:yes gene_type:complete